MCSSAKPDVTVRTSIVLALPTHADPDEPQRSLIPIFQRPQGIPRPSASGGNRNHAGKNPGARLGLGL